jgi:dTDP-4-dehydrorhamnose reductase
MNILILGGNGQLGHALHARARALGTVTALGRQQLDLHDNQAIRAAIDTLHPDVVCNAAAYTAVDRAEQSHSEAFQVNATAPEVLAHHCAKRGIALIHYSTDYVFDGRKTAPYVETDTPAPLNVYGASKQQGETAIMASSAAAIVLRTSWVFGDHGQNFAKTILRRACERDSLNIVDDQHGAPTWAGRLAELTTLILEQAQASGALRDWLHARRGTYHACAAGVTSWAGYARFILEIAAQNPQFAPLMRARAENIHPIPTSAYPTPAIRPSNSQLDCTRLRTVFGYRFPAWQSDVESFAQRQLRQLAMSTQLPN